MADLCNVLNSSDTSNAEMIMIGNLYGHILITSLNNGIDINQSVINADNGVDGFCAKMYDKMQVVQKQQEKDVEIKNLNNKIKDLEKELKELKESKEK